MTCPICGSTNINYQGGGLYCPRCRKVIGEYGQPDLETTLDTVLAGCASLCLDDPADVAVLKGALLGALRGVCQ